jgi:hypothetical protein
VLVNAEPGRLSSEDPSSDRWLQYYREARRRRRALGPRERTRAKIRHIRNVQRARMAAGFAVVAVLAAIFYVILGKAG